MNTRSIQPVQSWSPSLGDVSIDTLVLTDFFHYYFDNGGGKVSYSLSGIDPTTQSSIDYFSGIVDVPSSVIQQWGSDDEIIFQFVATTLGLTII
jgi:hypothetical protein